MTSSITPPLIEGWPQPAGAAQATSPAGGRPAAEIRAICRLVAALGHANFMDELAQEYAALTGAAQVTTFFLEQRRMRCALAYRPGESRLVETLCRNYTRGPFERDPVLQSHVGDDRQNGDFMVQRIGSLDIYEPRYRRQFFSGADLAGKTTMISRRGERVVYVNFYFRDSAPPAFLDAAECGPLLAELVHKHDTLTGGHFGAGTAKARAQAYLKHRFPDLSPRETEVCARIACGFSVKAIALELGVSEETVVTFRKRAYGKLSISSKGELFAQCAGLAM